MPKTSKGVLPQRRRKAGPKGAERNPRPAVANPPKIMQLTPQQKRVCERVLNVFETGSPEGDYANISIFPDGPHEVRQITYGRSQTTEYGNLRELVGMYADANGTFSADLKPFVPLIGRTALVENATFKGLLRRAGGEDPVMRQTQDVFFDRRYFVPAMSWAGTNGFTLPLSGLVIYDSFVHSGRILDSIRALFPEVPPAHGGDEKTWTQQYVNARHEWLANHPRQVLHATVYRTRCFKREIARGNWDLSMLPIDANGTAVDAGDPSVTDTTPLLARAGSAGASDLPPMLGDPTSTHLNQPAPAPGQPAGSASAYVGALIALGRQQYDDFHRFSENDGPLRAQIRRYWDELGFDFPGVSTAWSAVFVSWCVRTAGASATEFRASTAHSRFVFRAIQNHQNGTGLFRGRPISEYPPAAGDIIHNNRNGQRITYEFAAEHEAYESHSAIVVETGQDANGRFALTVGGNEGDSVGLKRVELSSDGLIRQRDRNAYICVIQNLK